MLPSGFEITGGHVSILGREIASAGRLSARKAADATMVFQNPLGALNPTMRIGKQLVRVLRRNRGLAKRDAHDAALNCSSGSASLGLSGCWPPTHIN